MIPTDTFGVALAHCNSSVHQTSLSVSVGEGPGFDPGQLSEDESERSHAWRSRWYSKMDKVVWSSPSS